MLTGEMHDNISLIQQSDASNLPFLVAADVSHQRKSLNVCHYVI